MFGDKRLIVQDNVGEWVKQRYHSNGDGTFSLSVVPKVPTINHSTSNVGISSVSLLSSNSNRKYLLLVNDSDAVIYIKFGAQASLNQGIRLNPNGGSYEMSLLQGNLFTGSVHAISNAPDKPLLVTEGV